MYWSFVKASYGRGIESPDVFQIYRDMESEIHRLKMKEYAKIKDQPVPAVQPVVQDGSDGISFSGNEKKRLFRNMQDGTFQEIGAIAGVALLQDSRGFVPFDYDQDGALDLLVRHMQKNTVTLLHNEVGSRKHWLRIQLVGTHSNRDAVGAKVRVETEKTRQYRELMIGDGYLSGQSKILHFGLDDATTVRKLQVTWPSGGTQEFEGIPVNRVVRIEEGKNELK